MIESGDRSLRAEHDRLLRELSSRQSIFHLAHAAVSTFVAGTLAGAAFKLSTDVEFEWAPHFVVPTALLAAVAGVYALARLFLGARVLGRERARFRQLKEMREVLAIDQIPAFPSSQS